jgi:hypothetical protein
VAGSVVRSAAVSALAGRWRGPCRWSASAPARQRLAPQLALELLDALRLGRRPGLRAGGLGVERLLRRLPPRGEVGQLEPFAAQQGTQRGLIQVGGLRHDPELLRAGPILPFASWHDVDATEFAHPPRACGLRDPDRLRQQCGADGLRADQSLHHPRLERGTGLRHDRLHLAPGLSHPTAALAAAVRQPS